MALTNAERQAHHRERRKAQSSLMEAIILKTRRDIREWKRGLALISCGWMRLRTNGVDTSAEQAATLERIIRENQVLVDQYDPHGLLVDDDIELGDVPPQIAPTLWRDRPVSYSLDPEGRAHDLRVFDADSLAISDAARTPGRFAGRIGDESWSVRATAATSP